MTMFVDMFFHEEDKVGVNINKDTYAYTLDIRKGCDRITLFFFDEKGLIDFKNQVLNQYEMLKRKGEAAHCQKEQSNREKVMDSKSWIKLEGEW